MMDSIIGEDPTLPLNFDISMNMSQYPNTSGFATPVKANKEANVDTPNSDPGVIYPAVLKVVGERLSPVTNHNMKDYSTQISDLKKENFSLKLRIFYMEERMQEQFDGDHEQLLKTNIELKVECDSLKKELHDKNDLLIKASNAVACMESAGPAEMQRARTEAEQEVTQLREMMNDKVQYAEKELRAAKQDTEECLQQALDMKKQLEAIKEEHKNLLDELEQEKNETQRLRDELAATVPVGKSLEVDEKKIKELSEQTQLLNDELSTKDSTIVQLKNSLSSKQTLIELMNEEKETIYNQEVVPLQKETENLRKTLKETEEKLRQSQRHEDSSQTAYQEHITEQQQKLDEYELATRQITEELEKRETEVKDLKDALKDSDETNEELKSELDKQLKDLENFNSQMKKDVNKRDRAITGLTQMLKRKDEEIQRLIEELKTYELKEEEFLSNIEKLEKQKPQSSARDSLIAALRSQLKESDCALQDALDGKLCSEDEHQKYTQETNTKILEKDRFIESLQQQLGEHKKSVAFLDTQIKGKDAEIQSMTNEYKLLLDQLKSKEDECLKTLNERDELLQQCEEEKRKFAELAQRTLRQCPTSFCDMEDMESKIKTLEQKLELSDQALQNANEERDNMSQELNELQDELESVLQAGKKEAEKSRQKLAHQDVRIHQVEELLRWKEEDMNSLEKELRFEMDKLTRINRNLQDRLRNQQSMRHHHTTQNGQPENTSEEETSSFVEENVSDLQQQIHKLLKKIATKDKVIQDLRTQNRKHKHHTSFHEEILSESSSSSNQFEDEYGFEYHSTYHYRPSKSRKRRSRSSPRKLNDAVDHSIAPLRQSHTAAENSVGNYTLSNTFGVPLDQTSYLGMPDGYKGTPEQDSDESLNVGEDAVRELREILQNTRNELLNATKEISDLRKACTEQDKKLKELHNFLNEQIAEKTSLADELKATNKKMMEKESEILGLLARIKDGQSKPKSKTQTDSFENGFSEDNISVSSQCSRNMSGDESDGMSNLKRNELHDVIGNLRKKLNNAEKVNDLLKQHLQQQTAEAKQKADVSMTNPKLVDELSSEVERLKAKLQENDRKQPVVGSHEPSTNKKAILLRSKLPILKDKVGNGLLGNSTLQELERARMHNRKLNERLASTEQTVRQQADKLNKCRVALREAGIVSPPLSPIRAARSVPNLFQSGNMTMSPELTPYNDMKSNAAQDHSSSSSSDTSDVGTQTSTVDSGIQMVSPQVEKKYNSLIQAQAKELSDIRQQIQQAKENTVALDSEMDVLNQYVESLLHEYNNPDPVLANGVKTEIEHSKSLIRKLRNGLSNNAGDTSNSEDEQANSSDYESVEKSHSTQVQRLSLLLQEKNIYISELQSQLEKINPEVDGHRTESQPLSGDTYTAERWLEVPSEAITYSSCSPSLTSGAKQKHLPGESGEVCGMNLMLSSSHPSLHTAQEDELLITQDDSSRLPSALTDNDDRFAPLPSMLENTPPRLSWPLAQNPTLQSDGKSRKSMPMYQKTIAVTEYLPPNLKSRKDQKHSGSSLDEKKHGSRRKHLLTNSEEAECTAAYGGAWIPVTPQKVDLITTPPKHRLSYPRACAPSSCDDEIGQDEHRMSRELDRLRRRLSDSKRINRTLKEELELATRSLQRAKDSIVPGYQRSPHRTTDMLAQHLSEIRGLRQRLEASIATNDNLRVKLEERLKQADTKTTDHVAANIYVSSENGNSPRNHSDLQQRLHHLEDENANLSDRLAIAEKGRKAYEDALNQMNKLEQRLFEKSSQTDVLAQHIDQLQTELHQQNQFSERLTNELASRDQQLRQLKVKVEQNENEKHNAVNQLKHERNVAARLQNDLGALESQLDESRNLIDTLKSEVALHEKLSRSNSRTDRSGSDRELDLTELLQEIRSLRTQLERSIDANSALRKQLEEQLKGRKCEQDPVLTTINIHHMSPRKSSRQSSPRSGQNSARRKLKLDVEGGSALMTPPASASSGAEDLHNQFFPNEDSFTKPHSILKGKPHFCKAGKFTMCKTEDFSQLQKNLLDSGILAHSMQEHIHGSFVKKTPDKRSARELSRSVGALLHHLAQNDKLLESFWPVDLTPEKIVPPQGRTTSFSSSGVATGGQCSCSGSDVAGSVCDRRSADEHTTNSEADGLRREVGKLRHRLSTQDRLLQSTVERLHTTNRLKEGIENAIVQQLSRTHTVLRKARGNLEANVQHSTRK